MSNFNCEQCGVPNIDSVAAGYTAGCCHWPPEDDRVVMLNFGAVDETHKGFCRDHVFYRSENGHKQGLAVQPVKWSDISVEPAPYRGTQ
jgi:hypothetical protein